jgi:hypothetical protein
MGSLPLIGAHRPSFHIDPTSAGLLVVAAPGVGYVIAYFHELGWAQQFGIPVDLIAPQLGTVLAATAFLFAIAVIVAMLVLIYVSVIPNVPISPHELLVMCVLLPVAVLLLLASAGDPTETTMTWFATALLIIVIIAAIVFRSGILRDRLEQDAKKNRDSIGALLDRLRSVWLLMGIAFVVSLVFAYGLGGEQARNQAIFLVTDTPTPEVELAIYGDTVVLAPFDPSKHTVQPEFDVVKIGTTPSHLRYENVGPLKTDRKLILGT